MSQHPLKSSRHTGVRWITACLFTTSALFNGLTAPAQALAPVAAKSLDSAASNLMAGATLTPTLPVALQNPLPTRTNNPRPERHHPRERYDIDRTHPPAFDPLPQTETASALTPAQPNSAVLTNPTLQWNTFLGGSDPDDYLYDVISDTAGNLYVVGDSGYGWGTPVRAYGGVQDVFVAKLDAQGNLLWNSFLGSAQDDDYASALAVDASGNVYVSGISYLPWGTPVRPFSNLYLSDGFVAKLDANGNLVWNTFVGGGGYDWLLSLDLDSQGNVYAGGDSPSTWGNPVHPHSGDNDGFVAKFNPNTGVLLWNTFLGGADALGNVLSVDAAGNSYLTGYSYETWGSPIRPHSGNLDAHVVKLNASGTLVWNTFLGGGTSLDVGWGVTLNNTGTVTIVGESENTWGNPVAPYQGSGDALVAQLDANGNLLWHTFLGSSNMDRGYDVQFTAANNVVLIGYSAATWGTPLQAHSGNTDGFVAELNANGTLAWNTFFGGSNFDRGYALHVAGNGQILAVGYNSTTWGAPVRPYSSGYDGVLINLATTGHLLWHTFLGGGFGEGNGEEQAEAVAVDGQGNVYVTGYSTTPWGAGPTVQGASDIFVAKLDPQGNLLWHKFFGSDYVNPMGLTIEAGEAIAVNAAGQVYLTGYSWQAWGNPILPPGNSNYAGAFVAKLDTNGDLLWNTFLSGAQASQGYGLALTSQGHVVVGGLSHSTWGNPIRPHAGQGDGFVAELDANGNLLWNTFLGSSAWDYVQSLVVTSAGQVVMSGYSYDTWGTPIAPYQAGDGNVFAAKLASNGALVWNTFVTYSEMWGAGASIAADLQGNLYLAGYVDHTWGTPIEPYHGGLSDVFVLKLRDDGRPLWHTFLGSGSNEMARAVTVNQEGDVIVAGTGTSSWGSPGTPPAGADEAFVAKVSANGGLQWNTFAGAPYFDHSLAVMVDGNMQVYFAGYSHRPWGNPVRPFHYGYTEAFVVKLNDLQAPLGLSLTSAGALKVYSPITFTATLTQGTGLTYTWDFGDGTPVQAGPSTLTHQYVQAGAYTVTVTATNSLGSQAASTLVNIMAQSVLYLPIVRKP